METFEAILSQLDYNYAHWFAPISLPLAELFGLRHIPSHFPTFVFAVIFYQCVFFVAGPLSEVFSEHYRDSGRNRLSRKTRYQWKVKCVSQANAIILVWMAVRALWIEELDRDRAFGWHPQTGRMCAMACGYFFWDIIEVLYSDAGISFLIHGLACFCIFGMGFRPFIHYYGVRSLLWEASTPFLNIHWWLDKTDRTGSLAQMINGILLLITFFFSRIVYGSWITWNFWQTLYAVREQFSTIALLIYVVGNGSLNVLNWIWLSKMITALLKRFDGGDKPDKARSNRKSNGVAKKGKVM